MNKRNFIVTLMLLSCVFATVHFKNQRYEERMNLSMRVLESEGIKDPSPYLNGIDFNKPVTSYTIKKGTILIQYQTPNNPQGNFYSYEGATPTELGISERGYDPVLKEVVEKDVRYYLATEDVKALSSYAAPVIDDWSTPEVETQTKGKKQQLFTTCKKCFKNVYTKHFRKGLDLWQ